jgi:pilus assembly protein Flp/PilA
LCGRFRAANGGIPRFEGIYPACRSRSLLPDWSSSNEHFTGFIKDKSGATAIEYGLLAALIAVVIIGSVKLVGSNLSAKFNAIATNLS